MKIYEFLSPEDRLAFVRLLTDKNWTGTCSQYQPNQAKSIPKGPSQISVKKKVQQQTKPKKIPMATAPKPLPKPKPLTPTPLEIKNQQQKQQQDYAKLLQKALYKPSPAPMPKSLQPPTRNMIRPINHNPSAKEREELKRQANGEEPLKPL